jgi:arabinogalactan endo-1,4-beta-galactosidase
MRKTILTILLATAMTVAGQKYVGGDISMLTKYEEAGVVYKDKDGAAVQPLDFFKQQGFPLANFTGNAYICSRKRRKD